MPNISLGEVCYDEGIQRTNDRGHVPCRVADAEGVLVVLLIVLTVLIALFSLWWAAAYFYAYRRLHERLLLLQAGQGLVFALMFFYISTTLRNQQPLNTTLVGLMILMAVAAGYMWRARGGGAFLVQRYPRGMLDVLSFRKPTADLKRRVRGR